MSRSEGDVTKRALKMCRDETAAAVSKPNPSFNEIIDVFPVCAALLLGLTALNTRFTESWRSFALGVPDETSSVSDKTRKARSGFHQTTVFFQYISHFLFVALIRQSLTCTPK